MILSIDNGISGALCVLSPCPGLPPVALVPLPVRRASLWHRSHSKTKASGAKAKKKVKADTCNELDAVALKAIILGFGPASKFTAVIFEDCPDHADMAATMKSMAGTAAKIMAVLEILGLEGITYRIQSHTWQPAMLGKVAKGATKAAAHAAACSIWPGQDWRRTARCSTPDTGFIDAALIGHWAILHLLSPTHPKP